MGAIDFTEIPTAQSGPSRDDFELFAQEFLTLEGFKIVRGVDRGTDNGRDLIVEETRSGPGGATIVHWLVSCKHKALGGGSVTPNDESNVRDRIELHTCSGFIAFYSTVPSSGLATNLHSLQPKFELLIYNPALIERNLLGSAKFRPLAARYFPKSFNKWVQNSQHALVSDQSDDPQMIRNKFFLRNPQTRFEDGLVEARERNILVFLVVYDPEHPSKSKLDYSLGYFMEYQTTKRLVDQHFVPVLTSKNDDLPPLLIPEDDPLEVALWVVLDPHKNRVIRRESVYANPDEGLKRVRQVVESQGQALLPLQVDYSIALSCQLEICSSHCWRFAFLLTNKGTQVVREYAAKIFLPPEVAQHLRNRNSSDPVRPLELSFRGPVCRDTNSSYVAQSQLNTSKHTVIPPSKLTDHPLVPAGPSVPIAELDFGFAPEKRIGFISDLGKHPIELEFFAGSKRRVKLHLKQNEGQYTYAELGEIEKDSEGA